MWLLQNGTQRACTTNACSWGFSARIACLRVDSSKHYHHDLISDSAMHTLRGYRTEPMSRFFQPRKIRGQLILPIFLHPQGVVSHEALRQQLAAVVPQLYAHLSQPGAAEAAAVVVQGCACVWVGDGFAPVERVAFRY